MNAYSPRRQSKRWLDGNCPRGVLAIYYDKREPSDPYTIIYAEFDKDDRDVWFCYAGIDEYGRGYHGSLRRHEMQDFRYRNAHRACKWTDLPDKVKGFVYADMEEAERCSEG